MDWALLSITDRNAIFNWLIQPTKQVMPVAERPRHHLTTPASPYGAGHWLGACQVIRSVSRELISISSGWIMPINCQQTFELGLYQRGPCRSSLPYKAAQQIIKRFEEA